MLEINGHTKQLAIIGYPVEHSFSPKMHNFISEKMGNPYVYTALEVHPDNIAAAIAGIRALGFSGINVTAPHKYTVMQYLDEIAPQAQKLGSVNTIVNRNNRLIGYNTDADGLYRSMLHNNMTVDGKDILILGAGGAAKPISVFFAQLSPSSMTVVNRTAAKAETLAAYVRSTTGYPIETQQQRRHYDIVINATSVGMYPNTEACPMDDLSFIDAQTAAVDLIYNPAETVFLRRARENGAKTMNGLGMLVYQGIISYELFTDTKLPDNIGDMIIEEVFGA